MKSFPATNELLYFLPPTFERGVEYYYRRGEKFFFRTPDKKEKIAFVLNAGNAKECKETFVRGKVYKCIIETK